MERDAASPASIHHIINSQQKKKNHHVIRWAEAQEIRWRWVQIDDQMDGWMGEPPAGEDSERPVTWARAPSLPLSPPPWRVPFRRFMHLVLCAVTGLSS